MSLEKRLRDLRRKAADDEEARRREETEKANAAENVRQRAVECVRQLEQFGKQEIVPMLKLVNEIYLKGEGKLSIQGHLRWRTLKEWLSYDVDIGQLAELFVELRLSWGGWHSPEERGGEMLWLRLLPDGDIIVAGGAVRTDALGFRVNSRNRDWKKLLQDDLLALLSNPEACAWRASTGAEAPQISDL